VAERSGDTALASREAESCGGQNRSAGLESGVALRFPPQSKTRAAFAALLLALTLPASAADQYPPGRLTFQGHLTDAAGVPLGQTATTNAQVQFRLWRSATGTAPADLVWAEKQTVKVTRGFFNTLLGSGAATGVAGEFFTNNLAGLFLGPDASDRFLGVTVVGQGAEITPRIQFFSSPFAHLARSTANLLNESGQPALAIAPGAVGINLGGAAPGTTLDVAGTVKATTLTGDGSGLTTVAVAAANVTGTFDASRIADGVITGAKFATNTIGAAQLVAGAVTAQKLSPDAALAVAGLAGGVPNGAVIVSAKKVDPVLHNMGYVNIGRANFDGPKWTIRATKDTPNAPAGRMITVGSTDHRASATVWTGSKWILWSGINIAQNAYLADGAVFDPALNSWTPISAVGAPVARNEINFLWTGTVGLVWGGHNGAYLANGGIYDPAANTWSPMSTVNQPSTRCRQRNVWTGTEMFVWGGENGAVLGDGKLYHPGSNTWRNVSASPLSVRRDFHAFWTGAEVLIWGGEVGGNVAVRDGALYNPATDTWRMMSGFAAPSAREWAATVWTGREFIVWGGLSGAAWNTDGGRYDVASDTWIPFNTANYNQGIEGAAFWSGSKAYFLQGRRNGAYHNDAGDSSGFSFDPANNKFDYIPAAPITQTWMPHTWTGTELLTFATFRDGNDRTVLSFKPETETYFYAKTTPPSDNWVIRATKDTPNAPMPRAVSYNGSPAKTVWTGSKWIVWGHDALPVQGGVVLNSGALFNPADDSWQTMSRTNAPSPRNQFAVVWTGDQAIYWGGYSNNFIGDGKRYFPADNTWSNITATGALSARCRHTAVWSGTEMLVWGGAIATGMTVTNNGARYNPATDTWTAMAAVPVGFTNRADHLAVWTGTEMLIWGGSTNSNIAIGNTRSDGARYNPVSNTWTLMSSVNAPLPRALPLGVWTGTELIVWGGYLQNGTNSNTGGRYNPTTDTWTTFNTGSYNWSQEATAVWTGSKVIWAGGVSNGGMVNRSGKGGITYDPATGIVGTLPVAPIQQYDMPYTWTGTELLTFGSWEDALDRTVLSYRP
jgi:N-acetylneuraminic acid mutarotase